MIGFESRLKLRFVIWVSLGIFFAFFVLPHFSFAQLDIKGVPFIKNYSKNDYRCQPQNWSILQDERGVMYFGNSDGLLEFDGKTWNLLPMPNKTLVRALCKDKKGKIFIGAQGDFGYLNSDSVGRIQYASISKFLPKNTDGFGDIWSLIALPKKLIALANNQMLIKDKERWKFFKPDYYFNLAFKVRDKVFVGEPGKGLLELRKDSLTLINGGGFFKDMKISFMTSYDDEQILIGTEDDGMFLLNNKKIIPWKTSAHLFLIKNKIKSGVTLKDGNIAIGTLHNGLLILDKNGRIIQHLNIDKGLQNNTILCIYCDNTGNLWLGLQNGIDYVQITSPFTYFNEKTKLPGTGYASAIHQGKLYLGTNQGVFYQRISSLKDDVNLNHGFKMVANSAGQVWSLNNDYGALLLGHDKGGFVIKNDQAISISDLPGAWKFMKSEKNCGYIYEGCYSSLLLLEPSLQLGWKFKNRLDSFFESFRIMEEDKNGDIWLSHPTKGIYKVKVSKDLNKITEVKFYNSSNGLAADYNNFVAKVHGEIVFGTENGVYRYHPAKDNFEPHPLLNQFFKGNLVSRLLEDEQGNVWFVEKNRPGVLKKQPGKKPFYVKKELNTLKGKLVPGFDYIQVIDSANVIFGAQDGFVHYDPTKIFNTETPFFTLIRKVETIHSKSLLFGGNRNTSTVNKVTSLPYKENALSFSFSCTYYEELERNLYQYKLDGFDKNWSDWTERNLKEYTNLSEGDYIFRVRSKNVHNQMGKESIFRFKINPPLYRTFFAYILYSLGGMMFFAGAVKLNGIRKEKHFRKEKLKADKKIVQLQNEKLAADIEHKHRALASLTMHITSKNETLEQIKVQLKTAIKSLEPEDHLHFNPIFKLIENNIKLDNNWVQFEFYFDEVHGKFMERLREKYPDLTPSQLKLCAYLRMNLNSKEIATITNVSVAGIEKSRYRLRKKFNLEHDRMLAKFIQSI